MCDNSSLMRALLILAHLSPLTYRAFEFCTREVYAPAVLKNVLMKSCNIKDLKYLCGRTVCFVTAGFTLLYCRTAAEVRCSFAEV